MAKRMRRHGLGGTPGHHAKKAHSVGRQALSTARSAVRYAEADNCFEAVLAYAASREFLGEARAHEREAGMDPTTATDLNADTDALQAIRKCIVGTDRGLSGARRRRRR